MASTNSVPLYDPSTFKPVISTSTTVPFPPPVAPQSADHSIVSAVSDEIVDSTASTLPDVIVDDNRGHPIVSESSVNEIPIKQISPNDHPRFQQLINIQSTPNLTAVTAISSDTSHPSVGEVNNGKRSDMASSNSNQNALSKLNEQSHDDTNTIPFSEKMSRTLTDSPNQESSSQPQSSSNPSTGGTSLPCVTTTNTTMQHAHSFPSFDDFNAHGGGGPERIGLDSIESFESLLRWTFSPHVAVLASSGAQAVCQRNRMTFTQMLQPFLIQSQSSHDGSHLLFIKDLNGISHPLTEFQVILHDLSEFPGRATTKAIFSKIVSSHVPPTISSTSSMTPDRASQSQPLHNMYIRTVGDYDLRLPKNYSWFTVWRRAFLESIQPSDYEFLKHFISCMIVVSSDNMDPLQECRTLTQQQYDLQHQGASSQAAILLPGARGSRWFNHSILRAYIIIHDVAHTNQSRADKAYQTIKTAYPDCFVHLLQINSKKDSDVAPSHFQQQHLTSTTTAASATTSGSSNRFEPWLSYSRSTIARRANILPSSYFDTSSSNDSKEQGDAIEQQYTKNVNIVAATSPNEGSKNQTNPKKIVDHPLDIADGYNSSPPSSPRQSNLEV